MNLNIKILSQFGWQVWLYCINIYAENAAVLLHEWGGIGTFVPLLFILFVALDKRS